MRVLPARLAVAVLLFVTVLSMLMSWQPPSHARPLEVPQTSPHAGRWVSEQVRLAETLSPQAKSMAQTLKYGPVVFRKCPYCFGMAPR